MVQKKKLFISVLSIAIYLLLSTAYKVYIWPDYEDMGFGYEFNAKRMLIAFLIFFLYNVSIILVFRNFLFAFFSIYGLVLLAPNLILFHAMRSSYLIVLGICLIPFFVFLFSRVIPALKWPAFKERQRQRVLWIVIILLFIPFLMTYGLGVNLSILSLENVYQLRESSAANANRFTAYFYSSLSTWLLPMAMIFGLWTRRWFLAIVAAMMELYLFLVTGNKVTLLITLVIAGFALSREWYGKVLLFQLGLMVAALMLFIAPDFPVTALTEDLLLRRFAFLPALLNQQYHEFFEEPLYYSYSFLSWLNDYPFPYPPPQMIGIAYYGSEEVNATNGVIGDAIVNMNGAGVVIVPVLCALVVTYFDKLRIGPPFFALFFMLIQNFIDSAFFTSILTHGLLLFMIVAGFVLNKTQEPVE
ncbi:MAG: hypothetical protein AB7K37_00655 [Cyclobacteriaceae bacterium]